jgi:hypothetical protein
VFFVDNLSSTNLPMNLLRTALALLLLALLILPSGCAAAGAAAYVLQPPQKVEARYKPTTRPMAILVETYRAKGGGGPGGQTVTVRDSLASYVAIELRKNKVTDVVDTSKIFDLRSLDPAAFRKMSIDSVGRRVGADQVLYVDLLKFKVESSIGHDMVRGELQALVKIVDAANGETLWPKGAEQGFEVNVDTPFTRTDDTTTPTTVEDALARSAADQIAKLFYTWTVPE